MTLTTEDRDNLMSVVEGRLCMLCGGYLKNNKERYGWGAQGGRLKCSSCGLQLRLPWLPLKRAVLKVAKGRHASRARRAAELLGR